MVWLDNHCWGWILILQEHVHGMICRLGSLKGWGGGGGGSRCSSWGSCVFAPHPRHPPPNPVHTGWDAFVESFFCLVACAFMWHIILFLHAEVSCSITVMCKIKNVLNAWTLCSFQPSFSPPLPSPPTPPPPPKHTHTPQPPSTRSVAFGMHRMFCRSYSHGAIYTQINIPGLGAGCHVCTPGLALPLPPPAQRQLALTASSPTFVFINVIVFVQNVYPSSLIHACMFYSWIHFRAAKDSWGFWHTCV